MVSKKKNTKPTKPVREIVVGSKTVGEWTKEWRRLEGDFNVRQTCVNKTVGLFRAVDSGQTMALGQACEYANGGLRKRISDFGRKSPSSREHFMGEFIHDNRHRLEAHVLCVGRDENAAEITKQLRGYMLELYKPPKNATELAIKCAIAAKRKSKE